MPDKEEKTVDIDTSGPGADIELPEEKEKELEVVTEAVEEKKEEKVEEKKEEVKEEKVEEIKEEKPEEKKEELEQYSEGVKKRIAKLTKKWREAERQKEAAIDYAKGIQAEHSQIKTRMAKLGQIM